MLARANRLISADEFRLVMRKGSKQVVDACLSYRIQTAQDTPVRFGFVVGKVVGNAVTRNRIRRRMRAAAFDLVHDGVQGSDIVLRALPGAEQLSVDAFRELLVRTVQRS